MKKTPAFLALFLLAACVRPLWSYDEVRIEKVVPLVDKRCVPIVARIDNAKALWILDQENGSLQQVSVEGRVSSFLNSGKKKNALFKAPADFQFLPNGFLAVADPGFGRIAIIGQDPEPAAYVASAEKINWKKAHVVREFPFDNAGSIAVARDGIIAVAPVKGNTISIYSEHGVLLHQLFAPQKNPFDGILRLAYGRDGTLWVLDGGKARLHRFSADRKWLGTTEGLEGAKGLTVDDFGYAYVTTEKGRWKEISPDGAVAGTFGTNGKHPGEMLDATGIVIIDGVHLWVAEEGNHRLQLFSVMSKQKQRPVAPEPAAHVHAGLLFQWPSLAQAGVPGPEGHLLLMGAKKNLFQWVDEEGRLLSGWNRKSKGQKWISEPTAMCRDGAGAFWIADAGDRTLKKASDTGEILKTIASKGKKDAAFKNVASIQVRPDGAFLLVDRGGSRAQILNESGLFQFSIDAKDKKKGSLSTVSGAAANAVRIAVIDNQKKSLVFFDANGKYVSDISNKPGKAPVWQNITGICCDDAGNFLVLDDGAKRVRIFTREGIFLADFSAAGQHITAGPDHRVLLIGDKETSIYSIHTVAKAVREITLKDADGDVRVDWDPAADVARYNLYRSADGGPFSLVYSTPSQPAWDKDTVPGTDYRYALTVANALGQEGNWVESDVIRASKKKNVSLVNINSVSFDPVFTAAFKSYVKKPAGTIEVQNNNDTAYRDVKVAVSFLRYTDYPTEVIIPTLKSGEKKSIPVTITFNNKVLELTENTPVQADVRVSYVEDNIEKSTTRDAPVMLYSRNAISWSDKARISSFITPRDGPIADFSRVAIKPFVLQLKASTIGKPLAKAILFFESMNALGISYVADPTTPYAEVSGHPEILDYVQFPRETLRRKTGDCDDTTALLASLLESVGVEVTVIDTPGHIFLMANLEETDASHVGLPIERFVDFRGSYWVPIETTRLSRGFMDAWQAGMSEVKAGEAKKAIEFIPVLDASIKYPPVTLLDRDKNIPDFPFEKVRPSFESALSDLQKEKFDYQVRRLKDMIQHEPDNVSLKTELGMVYVEGNKREEAKKIFAAMTSDPAKEVQAAAFNNLGNLAYLEGDFKEAAKQYSQADTRSSADGALKVNRARVAWKLGDHKSAKLLLAQARDALKEWQEYASDFPAELLPK